MNRILAVDDDLATSEFYKALLTEAGYAVKTAADATGAVMVFREYMPDLVMLDAEMPGGGGEKVFKITHEILGSGVPVLFITGMPERLAGLSAKNKRTRVLKKPVKNEVILSSVAEMLGWGV